MSDYVHHPPNPVVVPTTDGRSFPVRRIYLIGKNYADHVRELGGDPAKDPPVYFGKPADSVIVPTSESLDVPYPPMTENFHYEAEIVLALGAHARDVSPEKAKSLIWGTGLGCDLTRRDLQFAAKDQGTPWDMAKGFDHSAVMGAIMPGVKPAPDWQLSLTCNGKTKQNASVADMIWSPADLLSNLSKYVVLEQGDLIFTGTPEGVGPTVPGDEIEIRAGDLPTLRFRIADRTER